MFLLIILQSCTLALTKYLVTSRIVKYSNYLLTYFHRPTAVSCRTTVHIVNQEKHTIVTIVFDIFAMYETYDHMLSCWIAPDHIFRCGRSTTNMNNDDDLISFWLESTTVFVLMLDSLEKTVALVFWNNFDFFSSQAMSSILHVALNKI